MIFLGRIPTNPNPTGLGSRACSRENAGAHNQVPRIFQGINSYSTTYSVYHICTQRVKIWPVCKLEAFYERAAGTSASGNPPPQDIWGFKNDDIKPKLFPVFKGFTLCEIVGFRVKKKNGIFFACMYIKSDHFKKTVAQSSFLSKVLSFSLK